MKKSTVILVLWGIYSLIASTLVLFYKFHAIRFEVEKDLLQPWHLIVYGLISLALLVIAHIFARKERAKAVRIITLIEIIQHVLAATIGVVIYLVSP